MACQFYIHYPRPRVCLHFLSIGFRCFRVVSTYFNCMSLDNSVDIMFRLHIIIVLTLFVTSSSVTWDNGLLCTIQFAVEVAKMWMQIATGRSTRSFSNLQVLSIVIIVGNSCERMKKCCDVTPIWRFIVSQPPIVNIPW